MILADTNFWLALSLSKHLFHAAALDWLDRQTTAKSILFCRSTQQSVLRLLTTDGVLRPYGIPPMTNSAAWMVYERLRSDRRIGFAQEPAAIEAHWFRFAQRNSASPKVWMDAYLAAFAVTGGYQLVTTDRGSNNSRASICNCSAPKKLASRRIIGYFREIGGRGGEG